MRRITWVAAVVLSLAVFLAGCGEKSAADVVKDLDHVVGTMESYSAVGSMVLFSGEQAQEYKVEVWYQQPEFYRIALTNKEKNVTQIVLKNEEGVYVLTPHLNKSFKFKSDWPKNQGQIYLYQSLVKSIVDDTERGFTKDGDAYVFNVKANYQNESLVRQKIWLASGGYEPQRIELLDENEQTLITMDFSEFTFDAKFDADSFDMKQNLTSWNMQSLPTMSPLPLTDEPTDEDAQADETSGQKDFGVIQPTYKVEESMQLEDLADVELGDDSGILLRYAGDTYSFTILESHPQDHAVFAQKATLLDLGFTMGVLTGQDIRTLTWLSDGVEFRLTSSNLPNSEMILIAQSMQGEIGK